MSARALGVRAGQRAWSSGRPDTAAARCSWARGRTSQAVSHALRDSKEIEPYGFVARSPVGAADGLLDFRSLEQLERHFDAVDEVLIADADFPQDEAVELVDRCHRHGVRVRVAPSTMEILMDRVEFVPGPGAAAVRAQAAGLRGRGLRDQAHLRPRGSHAAAARALAAPARCGSLAIKATSRGPVLYRSLRPGIGGKPFAA